MDNGGSCSARSMMTASVILRNLSPTVSAMEENLHGHVAFAQRHVSGMTVDDREDLLLVDSGLPTDTFNKICRARLTEADADRRIIEAVARFRDAGRPFAWWVGPGSRPFDLERRLQAHGLRASETQLGMAMKMDLSHQQVELPKRTVVRRVRTNAELDEYVEVLTSFDAPDLSLATFFRKAAPLLLESDCPMRLFVGYVEGQAAATSELFAGAGVAGVHMVATRSEFRRRGLGTALTWAALDEARGMGLKTATLQASAEGEGVYLRLGFRVLCRFVEYQ